MCKVIFTTWECLFHNKTNVYSLYSYPLQGCRSLSSLLCRGRGEVHPTNSHLQPSVRIPNEPDMFGLGRSQRAPTQAQESHVNSKQKGHSLDLNPSCFELKVQTIEPPCFYLIIVLNLIFVCWKNR